MKHFFLSFLLTFAVAFSLGSCSDDEVIERPDPVVKIPNIIIDTDLGNSTDDLFALQALFAYQAEGRCNVKAVMHNRPHKKCQDLMDRMMHFYKADNLPLGLLAGNENFFEITPYYQLVDSVKPDGKVLLEPTGIPLSDRLPAWKLYRKLLSEAEDHSITIVSIGMFTNLGLLLDSPGDEYSPLSGSELVAQKTTTLEVMAGCFSPVPLRYPTSDDLSCSFMDVEYNILGDIPLARKVIENWPGQIRMFPLEEGMSFPSIHDDIIRQYAWQKDSPIYLVHERYDEWKTGDVGQYLWDVFPVIHAIFEEEQFSCSDAGIVSIDDKGVTTFNLNPQGNAHIVSFNTTGVSNMWKMLSHISVYHP